jgi:hypothetical protein
MALIQRLWAFYALEKVTISRRFDESDESSSLSGFEELLAGHMGLARQKTHVLRNLIVPKQ